MSNLAGVGAAYAAVTAFPIAPAHVAGLFCGALTSTPSLQAALAAAGSNGPALGYGVAFPVALIVPILHLYVAGRLIKAELPAAVGTGLELRESVVRNPTVTGRTLGDVSAELPAGVQVVVVREGHRSTICSGRRPAGYQGIRLSLRLPRHS